MGKAATTAAQLLRGRRQRGLLQHDSRRHQSYLDSNESQIAVVSGISTHLVMPAPAHHGLAAISEHSTHLQLLLRVLLWVLLRLLLLLLCRSSCHIRCSSLGKGGGRHALAPCQHLQHALLDGALPAYTETLYVRTRHYAQSSAVPSERPSDMH